MCNLSQNCDQTFVVNCGPGTEGIVSGTPKWVIQEKTKAHVHAASKSQKVELLHPFGCAINERKCGCNHYCILKGPPDKMPRGEALRMGNVVQMQKNAFSEFCWDDGA
jgi:hypothetical protein